MSRKYISQLIEKYKTKTLSISTYIKGGIVRYESICQATDEKLIIDVGFDTIRVYHDDFDKTLLVEYPI